MRVKYLLSILAILSIVGWGPFTIFAPIEPFHVPGMQSWVDQETQTIAAQASNLDRKVLKLSLTAYQKARKQGLNDKEVLTIIDYSKPSSQRRLWVVDMKHNRVLFNTYVAHGKNSGAANSTSFSNRPNSLKSSFGVFLTENVYTGHDGYSMRIQGLEHGVNDNAYRRNVVFHGANYVGEQMVRARGMMGRSWGCMAVSRDVVKPLINTIKNRSLVFAYYPDSHWLKHSTFLS
jgi:hypothetical protein